MATRKSNAGLFAGVAVVVTAIVGAAGWFLMRGAGPAAGAAQAITQAPALPTGRLELLETNVSDGRYLVPGDTARSGGAVQATVLIVGKSPTGIAQRYALLVKRETIDCRQRRIFNEMAGEYDAKGALKNHELQSGPAGRPADGTDVEVRRLCAEKPTPAAHGVDGYKGAQRETQTPPDDLYAMATANPTDPDLWASVCANGVRRLWSKTLLKDCDRAVTLNPKSAAILLDRGFQKLAIGQNAPADADFQKAMVLEPQNPAALFGHSLVAAMRHDMAASRRDRDKALDIDPKVPDWIEANYRFQISDAYRAR